nr:GRAM domain-containing protein 2B isoform X2 [Oryctolagus cuniculus]
MGKKRPPSNDTVFRFELPGSPKRGSTEAPHSSTDSPGSVFLSSEAENGVEEKKKGGRSPAAQSPTSSVEAESPDSKRSISLWSKSSFDGASLASDKNDYKAEGKSDSKSERKKSSSSSQYKANMHFHKLFLEVPTEEPLRQSFTCALQKEILYQGKLFVSENWICFHSKVFGKDTKISIPAFSVTLIKKTKTALLVPNALIIATVTDRYIFVSLLSRDSTYKLLKSVCAHLENASPNPCNTPNPCCAENSFRADRPSSLPLDFNDEFPDLDGVVRQRRQDMEGYSSSGSQTPESEHSRDFHVTESQTVLNVSKGEAKPSRADAHVKRVPEGKAKSVPAHSQVETSGILHQVRSQKCPTLHHILIFYAIIVCALIISTFYMRYRINTLEERLGSLTSFVDSPNTEQTAPSGLGSQVQLNVEVLCQELSANIVKLEKLCIPGRAVWSKSQSPVVSPVCDSKALLFPDFRYRTTCRSCLRTVTERAGCLGPRHTSRFPLRKVLPSVRRMLPAGQRREQMRTQTRLHPEGSSSGKGEGEHFGSCAINVELDPGRKSPLLLPGAHRSPSGGLRQLLGSLPDGLQFSSEQDGVSKHSTPRPPSASLPYPLCHQPSHRTSELTVIL